MIIPIFKNPSGMILLSLLSIPIMSAFVHADEENSIKNALLRYNFKQKEITELCSQAIESARKSFSQWVQDASSDPSKTENLIHFEEILATLDGQAIPLTFMKEVSTQEDLRSEASDCGEKLGQFGIEIFSRSDLYEALRNQKGVPEGQKRLWEKILISFQDTGLGLSEEAREKIKKLRQELVRLENQFGTELNEDKSVLKLDIKELSGLSESFINSLKKTTSEEWIVPVNTPNYEQLLENADLPGTRKKMPSAWENRAPNNSKIYLQALQTRKEIALLMGYSSWADFQLKSRMVKNSKTALKFLNDLRERLSLRNQSDLERLLKFKKEKDPSATHLDAWDIRYFVNQIKKRDYQLDQAVVREYFPKDVVIQGMFQAFSKLLGIKIVEVEKAPVWAGGVQFFQIQDEKTDETVGYFYTDFFPRDGKYGHAAAFPLRQGRLLSSGTYLAPVSAIVANFSPAEGEKPVLLTYDEVDTLFHEFGHIMHQTLTRAPFASFSGTSVMLDFVEAPSQMLENWVYSKDVLTLISGHYKDHSLKLPENLLQKLIEARDFNKGNFNTRQLTFGLFDMISHTADNVEDPDLLYRKLHQDLIGIPAVEDSHFSASFGHLMGGYDAGYYGYLWSDVMATDMFTLFEEKGLLNSDLGHSYRRIILEKGNMQDPNDLLKEFLGREPNSDAFFKKLGL